MLCIPQNKKDGDVTNSSLLPLLFLSCPFLFLVHAAQTVCDRVRVCVCVCKCRDGSALQLQSHFSTAHSPLLHAITAIASTVRTQLSLSLSLSLDVLALVQATRDVVR